MYIDLLYLIFHSLFCLKASYYTLVLIFFIFHADFSTCYFVIFAIYIGFITFIYTILRLPSILIFLTFFQHGYFVDWFIHNFVIMPARMWRRRWWCCAVYFVCTRMFFNFIHFYQPAPAEDVKGRKFIYFNCPAQQVLKLFEFVSKWQSLCTNFVVCTRIYWFMYTFYG